MLDKTKEDILSQGTIAAATTVPSSPGGSECSIVDTSEIAQMALQCEAVFDASATADVLVHVRASAEGGTVATEWDTVDYTTIRIPCTAGSRVQITKPVWPDPTYLTVMVENTDAAYPVTSVVITRETQDVEPT